MSILRSRDAGQFELRRMYALPARPWGLAIDDWNGDGYLDIAVTLESPGRIWLLLNDGKGDYVSQAAVDVATKCWGVGTGDFDHDGRPDLAVGTVAATKNQIAILLNRSAQFQVTASLSVDMPAQTIAVVDLNNDSHLDLVFGAATGPAIGVALGDGKGGFVVKQLLQGGDGHVFAIASGDLDGDGAVDIAVARVSSSIGLYRGSKSGTLGAWAELDATHPPRGGTTAVGIADFNRDGRPDLVAGVDHTPLWWRPETERDAITFLFNRSGRFDEPEEVPFAPEDGPSSLIARDLDDDGTLDIAAASNDRGSAITILLLRSPQP